MGTAKVGMDSHVDYSLSLSQANHLVGLKGRFLKLCFHSVEDLIKAKRYVM